MAKAQKKQKAEPVVEAEPVEAAQERPARKRMLFMPENLLSPNEAARELGCSGVYIKTLIKKGRLKAARADNGYYLIRPADLDEFRKIQIKRLDFKYQTAAKS